MIARASNPRFHIVMALAITLCCGDAAAQALVTLQGKTITMLIDSAVGGGTDLTGRLLAPFLTKHLPGNPTVIVRNMPGAEGMVALNYFVQQAVPDGLTVTTGGGPSIDPIRYRAPQSHFDPGKFEFIGAVGRGGSMLVVSAAAEKRFHSRSVAPVAIGIAGAAPRSGQLMALWGIEFLGWNGKWIPGYRSTQALNQALQQGEIDMTATSTLLSLKHGVESGELEVVVQSGGLQHGKRVPRPEFLEVPILADQLHDKLTTEIARRSFASWEAVLMTDKFFALPPGTPAPIVDAYQIAYQKIMSDAEFIGHGRKLSDVFEPMSADDVSALVKDIVDTPKESVEYVESLLRKQGIGG
jgi:tripartite-type tricarboxylate transporter receptor subunit TctC